MKTNKYQSIIDLTQTPCQIPGPNNQIDNDQISISLPEIKTQQKSETSNILIICIALYDQKDSVIKHSKIEDFNIYLKPNNTVKYAALKTIQVSKTGKICSGKSDTIIDLGKNIGKKSETTILQQILQEGLKKYNKHIDNKKQQYPHFMLLDLYKYSSNNDSLKQSKNNLTFPQYIQRKYDGLRCGILQSNNNIQQNNQTQYSVANVTLISRGLKQFTGLSHIANQIQLIFNYIQTNQQIQSQLENITGLPNFNFNQSVLLDGELYAHNISIQAINSLIRNSAKKQDQQQQIQFIIYDLDLTLHDPGVQLNDTNQFFNQTINNRLKQVSINFSAKEQILQILYQIIVQLDLKHVQIAQTYKVHNQQQLQSLFDQFITEKYEGAVIRNPASIYCYSLNDKRSKDTLKYKLKLDMEVEVVGYLDGTGKDQNSIIFECKVPDKNCCQEKFQVVQNITYDKRKALFKLLNQTPKYFDILKKIPLTIEYSALSQLGIPQQPRGIYFRTENITNHDKYFVQNKDLILSLIQ